MTGPLHTLLHGCGITWIPSESRWLCGPEMAAASGFVVDPELAFRTGGTCLFTRGQPKQDTRSVNFTYGAIGNAMHVNSAGGVFLVINLLTPREGSLPHALPPQAQEGAVEQMDESRSVGSEGPFRAVRFFCWHLRAATGLVGARSAHRQLLLGARLHYGPKIAPRYLQLSPRWPKTAPRWPAPRRPKVASRCCKIATRCLKLAPSRPQGSPRGP